METRDLEISKILALNITEPISEFFSKLYPSLTLQELEECVVTVCADGTIDGTMVPENMPILKGLVEKCFWE